MKKIYAVFTPFAENERVQLNAYNVTQETERLYIVEESLGTSEMTSTHNFRAKDGESAYSSAVGCFETVYKLKNGEVIYFLDEFKAKLYASSMSEQKLEAVGEKLKAVKETYKILEKGVLYGFGQGEANKELLKDTAKVVRDMEGVYKLTNGQRMRSLRIAEGLTQTELAERIGYDSKHSRTLISHYEKGLRKLSAAHAEKIAEALNTNPAYLMGWSDDPKGVQR